MKVKNINSSSRKTTKAIKEAFAELLQEKKELSNITVTELVSHADITRSSFYTHFDSIYDVAQELQNETLDVLINNITEVQSLKDFDNYIDLIFDYLNENEKIYRMMLASNDPLFFISKLNKHINKYLMNFLKNANHEDLILNITFFTDGCTYLLIKYFRNEIDNSLEEINNYIKNLFRKIFKNHAFEACF